MTSFLSAFSCSAVLALAAALSVSPAPQGGDDPSKAMAISYQLQTSGDFAGAGRALRPLIEAQPKAYFPRLRQGYMFLLAADYTNAADSYRAAAALEAAAVEPLLGLQQTLLAAERFDDAEKVGREVLQRDPKSYLGLSRQAWTLYKRGNCAAAADLYQKVLALYPGDADMLSGLGYAQLGLGKKTQAEASFKAVLGNVPGHVSATTGLTYCK
jgi:tetratricopeptide (TPR) repeat protein